MTNYPRMQGPREEAAALQRRVYALERVPSGGGAPGPTGPTGATGATGPTGPAGATLLARLVYDTAGTASFTKATYPTMARVRVIVQGGGGAGGGAALTGASQGSVGSGGSSGGYGEADILVAALGTSETVTVGAAGTGVSGGTGNSGGASSFGSHITAPGGVGGTTMAASGVVDVQSPGTPPSAGSGGYLNSPGRAGGMAIRLDNQQMSSGYGADSVLGAGGRALVDQTSTAGIAGTYGSGGSGGANRPSQSAVVGGAGGVGLVIVEVWS